MKFLKFIPKFTSIGYVLVKLFTLISFVSNPLGILSFPPYISISEGKVIFGRLIGKLLSAILTIAESTPAIFSWINVFTFKLSPALIVTFASFVLATARLISILIAFPKFFLLNEVFELNVASLTTEDCKCLANVSGGEEISVINIALELIKLVGKPLFVKVDSKSLTLLPSSTWITKPSTDWTKFGKSLDGIPGSNFITIVVSIFVNEAILFHASLLIVWSEDGGTLNGNPTNWIGILIGKSKV